MFLHTVTIYYILKERKTCLKRTNYHGIKNILLLEWNERYTFQCHKCLKPLKLLLYRAINNWARSYHCTNFFLNSEQFSVSFDSTTLTKNRQESCRDSWARESDPSSWHGDPFRAEWCVKICRKTVKTPTKKEERRPTPPWKFLGKRRPRHSLPYHF